MADHNERIAILEAKVAELERRTDLRGTKTLQAWVTREGALLLPERIRTALGVDLGGGVCFVDKGDGVVHLMKTETFLKLAIPDDE